MALRQRTRVVLCACSTWLLCAIGALGHTSRGARVTPLQDALSLVNGDQCTSLIAGARAMRRGGPMAATTNDCLDCDFRLSKAPSVPTGPDSELLVYAGRGPYPRFLGPGRGDEYLEANTELSIYPWKRPEPLARLPEPMPELNRTYAWIDGSYGIINEKQVAIGESTCSAILTAKAVQNGGKALFDIETLTRAALPRCATARCVIRLIGALAEEHGFHGEDESTGEGGESLQIVDTEEAWVFHILADDTGTSAVWAAQRVPDDHFTVVANQFIIRDLHLDDADNFMASKNVEEVARRQGLWPRQAYSCEPEDLVLEPMPGMCPSSRAYDGPFDFTAAYGSSRGRIYAPYAARRMWRALTLAAPSKSSKIHSETNEFADDYPFSVKPDYPIKLGDVFEILRDHYEGTKYDMTRGLRAGPYGDPARFDVSSHRGLYPSHEDDVTPKEALGGAYERAISIFRASYSWVSQSRPGQDQFAHVWFGQYAPHATQYLPLYVLPPLPPTFTRGSLYAYDAKSQYWVHAALANYAARFYTFTIGDIEALQWKEESRLLALQDETEARLAGKDTREVLETLQAFTWEAAERDVEKWGALFYKMLARFKDGQRIDDFHCESLKPVKMFYPKSWLQSTNFFKLPMSILDEESHPMVVKEAADRSEPAVEDHFVRPHPARPERDVDRSEPSFAAFYLTAAGLVCGLVGAAMGFRVGRTQGGYERIPY